MINGEIFSPEGAVDAGFLDELVEEDKLLKRAENVARQMMQLNLRAHAQTKVKAKADYLALLDRCIERDSEELGLQA